jgi:glycosyltransferase involved in cell wall biosynthesis
MKSSLCIVAPVYDVAPYLPRYMESLAALTPPADEVIVVDKGFADEYPRILDESKSRFPQMRVIRQENGGLSAARNTGLDAARGKYLAFVDSDGFVAADAYAEALQLAEHEQLDMVLLNANYHFGGREKDYAIYADAEVTGIVPGREWLRQRLRAGRLLHMVWMHLYRRDFIEANGFRFVPRLIHEDVIWTTRALLAARRVRYTGHVAVHYRIPLRSFSAEQSQRRLQAIVDSSVVNAGALAAMSAALEGDAGLRRLLDEHLVDGALSVFHKLAKMPDRRAAADTLRRLRRQGFLRLLWRHAGSGAQRRRIARHWLRSWLAGAGK